MPNKSITISLQHPVCNLIYGERLYYLLININNNLFDARDKLIQSLRHTDLFESSCAYLVFGESDIFLRVWATEKQVEDFCEHFQNLIGRGAIKWDEFLVSAQDTWFQRDIETKNPDWKDAFANGGVETILKTGEIPPCLRRSLNIADSAKTTKFFLFVREEFGLKSDLFRELQTDLRLEKPRLLAALKNVSLYRFLTRDFRGVLIKAEATSFKEASKRLVSLAEQLKDEKYAAHTTTYFCAQYIKPENDANLVRGKDGLHYRRQACHELLISHDCNQRQWRKIKGAERRVEKMTDILVERYHELFEQFDSWGQLIDNLRNIERWIVRESNRQLRGFLLDFYITLEKDFRELFADRRDLWRDESKLNELAGKLGHELNVESPRVRTALEKAFAGNRQNGEFLLRDIRACVSKIKRELADSSKNQILDDFLHRLERKGGAYATSQNLIENRNDLMHGNVRNLFEASGGQQRWVNYVENFLILSLSLSRVLPIIKDALAITAKKKAHDS